MGGRGGAKGGGGLGLSAAQRLQKRSMLFQLLGLLTKRGRANARARGNYVNTKRFGPKGSTVSLAGLRRKDTKTLEAMWKRASRQRALRGIGLLANPGAKAKRAFTNAWNKAWAIEKVLRERGIKKKPYRG